jgi:nucleotide-binding universal stress UspA family protein
MAETIICGVDGSVDSRAAVEVATQFAERLGARLVLAHVVDYAHIPYAAAARSGGMGPRLDVAAVEAVEEAQEEVAEQLLARVADEAGLEDAEQRVLMGFPAERLADLADEEDASLIVVGSRGRGAFKAAFLGSVSNSLVGVARRPVLIVPPGVAER